MSILKRKWVDKKMRGGEKELRFSLIGELSVSAAGGLFGTEGDYCRFKTVPAPRRGKDGGTERVRGEIKIG